MSPAWLARPFGRRWWRALALLAWPLLAACATASTPEPGAPSAQGDDASIPVADRSRSLADARAAERVRPPPRKPLATLERCDASVELVRASPILFEAKLVRTLYELELLAIGPPGLVVTLGDRGRPDFEAAALPPEVALRLPAGPARDQPAGASGALFELGGLAVAGLVNLALFPVTVPLGMLAGNPELFLMDVPSFTDGMFSDVVLDEATWNAEVARRAAPHQAELAREAARQARFAAWKSGLLLDQELLSCTVDESGRCALRVLWPSTHLDLSFGGLACADPPPTPPPSPGPADAATASPPSEPEKEPPISAWLPALPEPQAPRELAVPPRPDDDVRGDGARATIDAWAAASDSVLYEADAQPLLRRAERARGKRGEPLRDATLVCRIDARGDFDIDGSAPELRVRVAFGYDAAVAGQSFAMASSRRRVLGLRHVTLLPGELVKLSLVDVDAFVDDWVGMAVVGFDGTLPLRFEDERFSARCGAAEGPLER